MKKCETQRSEKFIKNYLTKNSMSEYDIDIIQYKLSIFTAILREHFKRQLCIYRKNTLIVIDYPHISKNKFTIPKKSKATDKVN